jgi:Flp pilus assembly protein TadG
MVRKLAKFFGRGTRAMAQFRGAEQGATAVEFAIIAPAFIATLFAIIQTTLFIFAQQTLQTAAVQAGRLIMTGSAQNSGMTFAQFQSQVCPLVSALFNCSNLVFNVQNYSSFSSASTSAPSLYNSQGQLNSGSSGTYSLGTQGEIMVVQIAYPWPIFGMPIGSVVSNTGYDTTEIMGVSAFRVEPY